MRRVAEPPRPPRKGIAWKRSSRAGTSSRGRPRDRWASRPLASWEAVRPRPPRRRTQETVQTLRRRRRPSRPGRRRPRRSTRPRSPPRTRPTWSSWGTGMPACARRARSPKRGRRSSASTRQEEENYLPNGNEGGVINVTYLQEKQGVPAVDPIDFFNNWQVITGNTSNPALVMKYCQNSGANTDWYLDRLSEEAGHGLHRVSQLRDGGSGGGGQRLLRPRADAGRPLQVLHVLPRLLRKLLADHHPRLQPRGRTRGRGGIPLLHHRAVPADRRRGGRHRRGRHRCRRQPRAVQRQGGRAGHRRLRLRRRTHQGPVPRRRGLRHRRGDRVARHLHGQPFR